MSSPTPLPRHGSFLLLQDEHMAPKGSSLNFIRRRSTTSLFNHWREEDEPQGPPTGTQTPTTPGVTSIGGLDLRRWETYHDEDDFHRDERRASMLFSNPQLRSMRLIGKAKRYRWERYWKTEEELAKLKKPVREYYERNNMLIQQYLYIDRLLNSSLPHDLLNEYNNVHSTSRGVSVPATISEEPRPVSPTDDNIALLREDLKAKGIASADHAGGPSTVKKVKRTPKAIYRPAETTPLLERHDEDDDHDHDPVTDDRDCKRKPSSSLLRSRSENQISEIAATAAAANDDNKAASRVSSSNGSGSGTVAVVDGSGSSIYGATATSPIKKPFSDADLEAGTASPTLEDIPLLEDDDGVDSDAPIVTLAIYINMAANIILLIGKAAVVFTVPSISVLASLVDALLDFLSTAIVWTTTWLISNQDQYRYPVGRRRLEPLGVLVFSVIMITSFVQVMLEAVQHLLSDDHTIIELGLPALLTMLGTIVVKGLCWLWCRMVKNSSVQALAADAATDVIFNAGSIAFPIIGFYARIWWLDALGGFLLSLVVISNWSRTSIEHIKHLSGFSATADQRNILLYLTMRFAKTIRSIQGLQAYHGGDKLIVEVDIVLDANMSLKDSHDLSESLQYVIESVPIVDRAFVHSDYANYNFPTHMEQQAA